MKKIILILCLFFLFSTSLLAKECNFEPNFKNYQEWIKTNNPKSSYLFVVNKVNSEAYCNYGYGVTEILAFTNCEYYRKEFAVDEKCEVYAVGNDIVFKKPELYEKLTGSKIRTYEEMIVASFLKEGEICDWIITEGTFQEYLDDLPPTGFYSAFYVVVGSDGRCEYGWRWDSTTRPLEEVIQEAFNNCESVRKENNIEGKCKPYDINKEIVWGMDAEVKIVINQNIDVIKELEALEGAIWFNL